MYSGRATVLVATRMRANTVGRGSRPGMAMRRRAGRENRVESRLGRGLKCASADCGRIACGSAKTRMPRFNAGREEEGVIRPGERTGGGVF